MKNRLHPIFVSLIVIGSAAIASADTYDWNGLATGGASGASETWDTVTANWSNFGTIWPSAGTNNDATFAGTAGTVTLTAASANDIAFNTTGYTSEGGALTLNGTTPTITTPENVSATISSVVGGSAGLVKTGTDFTGSLTLSGTNPLSGTVNVNSGILRITHSNALGTATKTVNLNGASGTVTSFLQFYLDPGASGSITLGSGISFVTATNSGHGIRNRAGTNEIKGNISLKIGLGSSAIGSHGGNLTLSGTISSSTTGRTLYLNGNSAKPKPATGAINNGSGLALNKGGSGTWVLANNNTYAGGTTVTLGKLMVTAGSGLGTGNVSLAPSPANSAASIDYAAATDAPLAISGTLGITGGTSTAIGATTTSASINVAVAATISDAAHAVNLHGVPGVLATTGTYTLISGGVGSSLNPTTPPTLGRIYNNSSFTVGTLSRTPDTLKVEITAAPPLATAYWNGNLAGAPNVWSVSDGTTSSNWKDRAGALTPQALTPGSATDVVISSTTPDAPPPRPCLEPTCPSKA